MRKALSARWRHVKAIGKTWWLVLPAIWGLFWTADGCIAKWGTPALKLWWDGHTTHLPKHWETWLIVLLGLMLVSLFEESFRHHRSQGYGHAQEVKALTDEVSRLRAELLSDKPSFKVNIKQIMAAPSTTSDGLVVAGGMIENHGGAGTVAELWMDLEIDGRIIAGEFPIVPADNVSLGKSAGGKGDMFLSSADYWVRSARATPIPKFSSRDGWLAAIFKGVTKEEIIAKKANVIVTCSDIFGNRYKGEKRFTGVSVHPFGIADMQSSESLSEQVANRLRLRGFS